MNIQTDISYDDIVKLISLNPKASVNFRYFNKRTKDCFKNHLFHFILYDPMPIGYGHLDFENDKLWLGMCVLDLYTGKGYGKIIIDELISNRAGNELFLSVDKENYKAVNLYLSRKFKIYSQTDSIYFCNLK